MWSMVRTTRLISTYTQIDSLESQLQHLQEETREMKEAKKYKKNIWKWNQKNIPC